METSKRYATSFCSPDTQPSIQRAAFFSVPEILRFTRAKAKTSAISWGIGALIHVLSPGWDRSRICNPRLTANPTWRFPAFIEMDHVLQT